MKTSKLYKDAQAAQLIEKNREFADECRAQASTASNPSSRDECLEMAVGAEERIRELEEYRGRLAKSDAA